MPTLPLPGVLPRPPMQLDRDTIDGFERLSREARHHGLDTPLPYDLAAPKWQFLCYLCEHHGLVLHGSNADDITELVPRRSHDADQFGDRSAVFAAADGIWPLYFAVLDRSRPNAMLHNAAFRVADSPASTGWHYFFSIDADVEPAVPRWRTGSVYLLDGTGFERQASAELAGLTLESAQVASLGPVRPLARLDVDPDDFPFLADVRRHDPSTLYARSRADPDGWPWLEPAKSPA